MLLAIDIGSRYIHVVEGEYRARKFKITRAIMDLTPNGALVDGEIIDQGEIISKIRNMLYNNKIRTKKVIFSINPGSMVSRKFIIPNVKKKEVLPILQNEMNSVINFSHPHIVDYTDANQVEDGNFEIEAVAVSEEIIKQYMHMAKSLKLRPIALDLHQNAIYKFMLTCNDIDYNNVIVADIGNSYMNTYLFKDSVRVFTSRTLINTEQYERTLVSLGKLKNFNSDFKWLDVSPQAISRDPILENTITLYLSNIINQLQRVMQFHISMGTKDQSGQISQVYLYGAMAGMKGITEYIESYIDIPVTTVGDIVNPKVCTVGDLAHYVNAIGALIRLD